MLISMPMMSDRDNVMHLTFKDIDGGSFLSIQTVDHPNMPVDPKIVRMFFLGLYFFKQAGQDVKVLEFEYANLKGYLPASLLNMTIASELTKQWASMIKYLHSKKQT